MQQYRNWSNCNLIQPQDSLVPYWQDALSLSSDQYYLPYGHGRSYSDVCLTKHTVINTKHFKHFLHFDQHLGILRCGSGVLLYDILKTFMPRGWRLPVVPGTQYVTIGGAIANDIHGKNHHRVGSFGCHVVKLALLRSDNSLQICSQTDHPQLFQATIGGLGLTGVILWADIQLHPCPSQYLKINTTTFSQLSEFIALGEAYHQQYEYTVAWIDCLSQGKKFSRGILMGTNWLDNTAKASHSPPRQWTMPCHLPKALLNRHTMKLFNTAYYHHRKRQKSTIEFYENFLFPLDSIHHWYRFYGKNGFYQFQCVLPYQNFASAAHALLTKITASGQSSFLSVLKCFGDIVSPGLLSFAMPGITIAVDFANRGAKTQQLLMQLNTIATEYGGRLYLAKDMTMTAAQFQQAYPNWQRFVAEIDPQFQSALWQRLLRGTT